MSRIGKKPIKIPDGVSLSINGSLIEVEGPKGKLTLKKRPEIKVEVKDSLVRVSILRKVKNVNAYWGLTRALIANMVEGVSKGYEKKLELVGVGYRAKASEDGVLLSLGFSHPIEFKVPKGVELVVEDNRTLLVKGIDKQLVGLVAAKIRSIRKPEPYKGKGIKYADEVVKRKPGKSGKV